MRFGGGAGRARAREWGLERRTWGALSSQYGQGEPGALGMDRAWQTESGAASSEIVIIEPGAKIESDLDKQESSFLSLDTQQRTASEEAKWISGEEFMFREITVLKIKRMQEILSTYGPDAVAIPARAMSRSGGQGC